MGRLDGKVFLVTGAGRGMGRSHALRLAQEGANLIVVDIGDDVDGLGYSMSTFDELKDTAAQVEALGRSACVGRIDVRDRALLSEFVSESVAQLGHLDGAVANAGVITYDRWDTVSDSDWRIVLDINLIGTWNTCLAAIPHLVERGGGSLVNISSAAASKGNPLTTPYTASKYGVVGLSLALANELAQHSIRVNTVHPTGVITGMFSAKFADLLQDRSDLGTIFQNALPVSVVEAEDISNAVLYLLSDEARYVTGTQLKVDAGVSIR